MKLVYSIPGKIWWIHNFLDHQVYKGIHNAVFKQRSILNLQDVKKTGHWNLGLYENLKPAKRSEVSNYEPFEKLKTLLKHNPYCLLPKLDFMTTTIHCLDNSSGINWHEDAKWKYGATYYLNRRWNKNWGGEFMFTDETGHGWIPVIGNSMIIVKAPISHKVNTILSPIIPRFSVQIFMK